MDNHFLKTEGSLVDNLRVWLNRGLKGISQIMLQENIWTGLFFLMGIAYGSMYMALAAVIAAVVGACTGRLLNFDSDGVEKGIYGFSPALVGVALIVFLGQEPYVWGLIVIGAGLAAILQHLFIRWKLPVFTFPFILVTWLVLFSIKQFSPQLLIVSEVVRATAIDYDFFGFPLRGFGQVIFQDQLLSGLLFFIGVFLSSPRAALYGLLGAILSGIFVYYCALSTTDIGKGLFSFNAVLCAIVFAGPTIRDGFWVLFSILLSALVSLFLVSYDIIQLTFPFVVASFATVLIKSKLRYLICKT